MLVPLYGFVRGDTLGLVVLIHDHQTVAELIAVVEQAAAVRVAPSGRARAYRGGEPLDPALTVAAAGLHPLDRVDVVGEAG